MFLRISLIAFAVAFLPVKPSFASERITVTGDQAQALFSALADAGVEARRSAGTVHLRASDLNCAEGGGIVFLPMHCSLQDEVSGKELRTDGALATALEDAGVRSSRIVAGELHETRIDASTVECIRNFEGNAACSIRL